MKIPDRIRLEHIREAILEIESYVEGVDKEKFIQNSLIHSATIRQFEIIGEAVRVISDELQQQHSGVPWRLWANFRNVLIHQYFGVDYSEVYQTVRNDLPNLKLQVEEMLNKQ